jgi:hypothetical protein
MSDNEYRRPVEDWAKEKATSARRFALAKRLERWPEARLLTEAEYDAAIARASRIHFR